MAAQVPRYSTSIKSKLAALRFTRTGAIADAQKTVEEVSRELDKQTDGAKSAGGASRDPAGHPNPQPVLVVSGEPTDAVRLQTILAPIIGPLLEAGVVFVLVIFMLVQREDLRNRLIRMVGNSRLTLTTRDDAPAGADDRVSWGLTSAVALLLALLPA